MWKTSKSSLISFAASSGSNPKGPFRPETSFQICQPSGAPSRIQTQVSTTGICVPFCMKFQLFCKKIRTPSQGKAKFRPKPISYNIQFIHSLLTWAFQESLIFEAAESRKKTVTKETQEAHQLCTAPAAAIQINHISQIMQIGCNLVTYSMYLSSSQSQIIHQIPDATPSIQDMIYTHSK